MTTMFKYDFLQLDADGQPRPGIRALIVCGSTRDMEGVLEAAADDMKQWYGAERLGAMRSIVLPAFSKDIGAPTGLARFTVAGPESEQNERGALYDSLYVQDTVPDGIALALKSQVLRGRDGQETYYAKFHI